MSAYPKRDGTSMTFPLEIFKEILDHLAFDLSERDKIQPSQKNLKTAMKDLSLVSKGFAYICQPYVFEDINVSLLQLGRQDCTGATTRLSNLAAFIDENPHISLKVRHMEGMFDKEYHHDGAWAPVLHLPSLSSLKLSTIYIARPRRSSINYISTETEHPFDSHSFGCQTLLDNYLPSSALTNLTLEFMHNVPIVTILSSPSLKSLKLNGCSIPSSFALPFVHAQTTGFNLEVFHAPNSAQVPLGLLAYCTRLEELVCDRSSSTPSNPVNITLDAENDLPFSNLRKVQLGGVGEVVDWNELYRFAEVQQQHDSSVVAFPKLSSLAIALNSNLDEVLGGPDNLPPISKMFKHAPQLKAVEICGANATLFDLRYLKSCRDHLTSLSLQWSFLSNSYGMIEVTLEDALSHLSTIQLPALETFRLQIYLGKGAYGVQDVHFSLWKLARLKKVFFGKEHQFPALQALELGVVLHVVNYYDDDDDDEEEDEEEEEVTVEQLKKGVVEDQWSFAAHKAGLEKTYTNYLTQFGLDAKFKYTVEVQVKEV
ncbi:hypothetical protein CVT24_007579 [Panaeolus cyanescens]|uniref:F-box domain-containing protein n=1 Tax=Panaeolus cyanescens TaxID=181874 RepID=A0A409VR15_9AGAR|nr:hypothetical protein CVT24_007579 [Panaeolus cyanescens]